MEENGGKTAKVKNKRKSIEEIIARIWKGRSDREVFDRN